VKNYQDVRSILTDASLDRDMRLVHLQGFRSDDAEQALRSGIGSRLAPALCGAGAILGVATRSPLLLGGLALTAVAGVFAPSHAIEAAYNVHARRQGAAEVPANLAGRRMGCFISTFFLGGSALAYATGADAAGAVLGLSLGSLALFVAATNICVPSIILTLLRGSDRTEMPALLPALIGTNS
jgi:hypothetical protein